jgi:hypothetical protein
MRIQNREKIMRHRISLFIALAMFAPLSAAFAQSNNPLPTEPNAWALGINNRGDVLGYSFAFDSTARIGVGDAKAEFNTYFVTPEHPKLCFSNQPDWPGPGLDFRRYGGKKCGPRDYESGFGPGEGTPNWY